MKKIYILLFSLLVPSVLLSFSSHYGIGYIFLILIAPLFIGSFFVFKTYVQKIILSSLIFLAIIPLVGLGCWVLNTSMHPLYNIVAFFILLLLIHDRNSPQDTLHKHILIDRTDVIAFFIAIIPVVIIGLSYMTSPNRPAALFQLASEGWDNGSHILMMESIENEHGYVYGPYSEIKDKMIQDFGNYPQAWHLATVNFADGFGGSRFIPTQPIHTIAAYVVSSLVWMVLACYLFIVTVTRLYESISKKTVRSLPAVMSIGVTSILIQSVVVYGAFASGFTNYIGCLVYILLFTVLAIDVYGTTKSRPFILLLLFGTLSIISWFLTLPAILLALCYLVLTWKAEVKSSILTYFSDLRLLAFSIVYSIPIFLQLYIFGEFSAAVTDSPLNEGVRINAFTAVVGVFPVSQLLFSIVMLICALFYIQLKNKDKIRKYIALSILPWLSLAAVVFFYQNITVGYNSYYLSKTLGICLFVAGVFLCVYIAIWITNLSQIKGIVYKSCFILVIAFSVLLGTGQSTYGLNKLFQKNARTTYATSVKIVSLLERGDVMKNNIVVLRNNIYFDGSMEDHHGKLEQRVLHKRLNCAYRITRGGEVLLKNTIERLASCADKLKSKGQKITVITSDTTYDLVKELNKDNIFIENVSK